MRNDPKKKTPYHELDTPKGDEFPDLSHTASASELTGLMHRTPVSGEEWGAYQELHPMAIPPAEGAMCHTAADRLRSAPGRTRAEKTPEDPGGKEIRLI